MRKSNIPPSILAQSRNIVLTSQQVSAVPDATANQPEYRDLHDVATIMLGTGIRSRELTAARWSDIDCGNGVMRVPVGTSRRR